MSYNNFIKVTKPYLSKFLIFLLVSFLLVPLVSRGVVKIEPVVKFKTFQELIGKIIDILWALAMVVAPIMLIVAGFYFITAAGDPKKITQAKQIIIWTLIGLIIVISAKGIIVFLEKVIKG